MPTNFQLKQLKLKLDIVEKPENRVHKLTLTDSNGAQQNPLVRIEIVRVNLKPVTPTCTTCTTIILHYAMDLMIN